jgi:L-lactate utilization protein LutC
VKFALRIYTWAARHPRIFGLAQSVLGWCSALLPAYTRMPAFTGWGLSKDLPRPAGRAFRSRWKAAAVELDAGESRVHDDQEVGGSKSQIAVPSVEERRPAGRLGREEVLERFISELTLVAGQVRQVGAADLTREVLALLGERGIDRIHVRPEILDGEELSRAGVSFSYQADASVRAGVTGALCGVADTGSILVPEGNGSPLQASLLPEIHIAVLRADAILPSLADALRLPEVIAAAATVVITGPSRTGDIEMTHTIGVHGPGEVHVFIVGGIMDGGMMGSGATAPAQGT